MKLAQIVAQTGTGVAPYPRASAGRAAVPYVPIDTGASGAGLIAGALAKGVSGLDDAAARALDLRGKAEAAKQRVADETEAAEMLSRFEVAHEAFNLDLQRGSTDPKAYLGAYAQGVQALREQMAERASPGARAIVDRKLPDYLAGKTVGALRFADGLYKGSVEASHARTLDNFEQLAGQATDPEELMRLVDQAQTSIGTMVPIIGAKEAATRAIAQRERMYREFAWRAADGNPAAFLQAAEEGSHVLRGIDPERRNTLIAHARTRLETIERQRNQDFEKWVKGLEEEAESERQGQLTTFQQRIYQGVATVAELDNLKAMRVVRTPQEYRTFADAIRKAAEDEKPSDPALLQDIDVRLNQAVPQVSHGELAREFRAGRLNSKDYNQRASRLTSRADHLTAEARSVRAEGRAVESHNLSLANQAYTQARRRIDEFFGITGPFDSLNMAPEAKNLHFLATEELANRTLRDRGGKENPGKVVDEQITRFTPMRDAATKLSTEKLQGSLSFRSPEELRAAKDAGAISQAEYDRQLAVWARIKRDTERAAQTPPTMPGQQPAGKGRGTMGRTSTTKPETGSD